MRLGLLFVNHDTKTALAKCLVGVYYIARSPMDVWCCMVRSGISSHFGRNFAYVARIYHDDVVFVDNHMTFRSGFLFYSP